MMRKKKTYLEYEVSGYFSSLLIEKKNNSVQIPNRTGTRRTSPGYITLRFL